MDPYRGAVPGGPRGDRRGVLLLETSEEIIPAQEFGWILRSLGERGLLAAVDAVLVARPPAGDLDSRHRRRNGRLTGPRSATSRSSRRPVQPRRCGLVGVPFGHTRPQWILPYGGEITVDGVERRVWSDYR